MPSNNLKEQFSFKIVGMRGVENVVADCYLKDNTLFVIVMLDDCIDIWKIKSQLETLINSPYRCVFTFIKGKKRTKKKLYDPSLNLNAPNTTFFAKKPC